MDKKNFLGKTMIATMALTAIVECTSQKYFDDLNTNGAKDYNIVVDSSYALNDEKQFLNTILLHDAVQTGSLTVPYDSSRISKSVKSSKNKSKLSEGELAMFDSLKTVVVNGDTLIDLSNIRFLKPLPKVGGPYSTSKVWDTRFQKTIDYVVDTMDLNSEVVTDDFIKTFILTESRYYPWSKNDSSSASGLGQLLKGTWKQFSDKSFHEYRFDPLENISAGTNYLFFLEDFISRKYSKWGKTSLYEQQRLVEAGYYAGHGALQDAHFDITRMDDATQRYVALMTSRMDDKKKTREKDWLAKNSRPKDAEYLIKKPYED